MNKCHWELLSFLASCSTHGRARKKATQLYLKKQDPNFETLQVHLVDKLIESASEKLSVIYYMNETRVVLTMQELESKPEFVKHKNLNDPYNLYNSTVEVQKYVYKPLKVFSFSKEAQQIVRDFFYGYQPYFEGVVAHLLSMELIESEMMHTSVVKEISPYNTITFTQIAEDSNSTKFFIKLTEKGLHLMVETHPKLFIALED